MLTQRFKLTIAYRGSAYHGWQRQATPATWKGAPPPEGEGLPTIQEICARAIAGVVGHPVKLVGSSRTDAGVHAKGQVAHFDTETEIPPEGLRRAVNHQLPRDILIRAAETVPDAFDAIRSTISKRYQYFLWHAPDRPVLFPDLAWHRWQQLDIDAMQRAAALFVGEHDFVSFAKPGHGRRCTVRTVYGCTVHYRPPRLVVATEGSGFLWHMVRIMVGTLVEVGLGRYPADRVGEMIAAQDRKTSGPTAPPHGLYLQWIRFGDAPGEMPGEDEE